ncbi:hypothetical protein [Streptomyces sp. NPDC002133]|uniref:hypothetical protein n=1 Tax=Streptomyces sp. NPDC002133 TaxID=3154409 RepID=UPI00331D48DB
MPHSSSPTWASEKGIGMITVEGLRADEEPDPARGIRRHGSRNPIRGVVEGVVVRPPTLGKVMEKATPRKLQ